MSNLAFTLIIISAVMHAIWNLLVKQSHHKTVFIWWMFLMSSTLFTLTLPFAPEQFHWPEPGTLLMVVIGAVAYVLYHLLNGRAYRDGDLSLIYPLSQTSMIYVPIWGMLLLGEKTSLLGAAGIVLVILGTFSLQMRHPSLSELTRPFSDLRSPSTRAALSAGFIYSVGSIAEKTGVTHYPPIHFTYFLILSMLLLMTANLARPKYRSLIAAELRENWKPILWSGPVVMASFLTFRYGLNLSPVGYAVPVRQVSIMVGVLVGIVWLRETCGMMRLVSASVIVAGAVLIRFG
ncbi:EamA family transporter [Geomonas sp. Red32]|uniref:EamA family transporter n=1 Tax=Geomonas sp. Red32 TaxID=2912856 RepID=UPI00202CD5A2|nr:EamA family transporter [Geomonas sp. Red32]MCM0083914.1 EamA family transporter [Geomonas sp. Red32]